MDESELFEKACEYRAKLGEGPLYDERNDTLYWVDISEQKIVYKDLLSSEERTIRLPDVITSIQLTEDVENLVCTLRHGFYRVTVLSGKIDRINGVEENVEHNRFNDGKCDSVGRYWAGTMNFDKISQTGSLYVLDLNKQIRKMVSGLVISNGLAWSLDNRKMYLIDTPQKKVFQFDFEKEKGTLGERKVCIDFAKEEGRPDGMTIDSEGKLWVVHARAGRISRWDPEDGEKTLDLKLPVNGVTSLIFGGKKFDRLFVTTGYEFFEERDAGYLYSIDPGAKGLPSFKCKV